ncbi:hypothetical protein [Halobacillus litoralis]|uniref:hypothetical protein n=1 Tax=Halobacillus TaxID=45667 RepID=UPI0013E8C864|nr:hypothetical protein [Halobacillus litoralis]
MIGPENNIPGFQANPNSFSECGRCGKPLATKREEELKLCKECQKLQENHKVENDEEQ